MRFNAQNVSVLPVSPLSSPPLPPLPPLPHPPLPPLLPQVSASVGISYPPFIGRPLPSWHIPQWQRGRETNLFTLSRICTCFWFVGHFDCFPINRSQGQTKSCIPAFRFVHSPFCWTSIVRSLSSGKANRPTYAFKYYTRFTPLDSVGFHACEPLCAFLIYNVRRERIKGGFALAVPQKSNSRCQYPLRLRCRRWYGFFTIFHNIFL